MKRIILCSKAKYGSKINVKTKRKASDFIIKADQDTDQIKNAANLSYDSIFIEV